MSHGYTNADLPPKLRKRANAALNKAFKKLARFKPRTQVSNLRYLEIVGHLFGDRIDAGKPPHELDSLLINLTSKDPAKQRIIDFLLRERR